MADIPVNANDALFVATITVDGQTLVDFDFLTFDADDMRAIHVRPSTGLRTTLTEGVDFTVTGIEQPNGGTLTLMGGAPVTVVGDQVVIYRASIIERLADYQKAGDFRAVTVNREMDIVFMIMQELARDIERALKVPLGAPSKTLPDPEPYTALGWSPDLTLENVSFSEIVLRGGGVPASNPNAAITPFDFTSDPNAAADGFYNPVTQGFDGYDWTAAFQAALDYCSEHRRPLYVPPGNYRFARQGYRPPRRVFD